MNRLWLLAFLLYAVSVIFAQAPSKWGPYSAIVGQPFSQVLTQMQGATSCTVTPTANLSQSKAFSFDAKTATVSGTPTKPGWAAMKIVCTWKTTPPKSATQLVQIHVIGPNTPPPTNKSSSQGNKAPAPK